MVFRSVLAGAFVAGGMLTTAASAQVLLCPEPPAPTVNAEETSAEAERLLQRLTVALDLHGHRGVDEAAIMRAHADTPGALLAKLGNVVERCNIASGGGIQAFHDDLPGLREAFLDATDVADTPGDEAAKAEDAGEDLKIKAAVGERTDAERVEQSIDLSVRELWRKLWFRPADEQGDQQQRWAVIVASPSDADAGWDKLGEHQRRWKDAYFQLHEPYYDDNPHHAIVAGRRLPEAQARRLLDYVKEIGMADDAYVWLLPADEPAIAAAPEPTGKTDDGAGKADDDAGKAEDDEGLDLSILED